MTKLTPAMVSSLNAEIPGKPENAFRGSIRRNMLRLAFCDQKTAGMDMMFPQCLPCFTAGMDLQVQSFSQGPSLTTSVVPEILARM